MKIFFLFNPSRVRNRWAWRDVAAKQAKRYGWTPRFGDVDRLLPHSTSALLDQALEEGCSRIVTVGGDGSLHRTINLLAQKRSCAPSSWPWCPPAPATISRVSSAQAPHGERLRAACSGKAHPHRSRPDGSGIIHQQRRLRKEPGSAAQTLEIHPRYPNVPTHGSARHLGQRIDRGIVLHGTVCNAPYFSGGSTSPKPSARRTACWTFT